MWPNPAPSEPGHRVLVAIVATAAEIGPVVATMRQFDEAFTSV
jgi:hypothetical protein